MDLSGVGGVAGAKVTGTVVQHLDPAGGLRLRMEPIRPFRDHRCGPGEPVRPGRELDPRERAGPGRRWEPAGLVPQPERDHQDRHPNRRGAVADGWTAQPVRVSRLGTALSAPARRAGWRMEELVLLDNFGEAEGSRAERYVLDETGRTARLTGTYVPTVCHAGRARWDHPESAGTSHPGGVRRWRGGAGVRRRWGGGLGDRRRCRLRVPGPADSLAVSPGDRLGAVADEHSDQERQPNDQSNGSCARRRALAGLAACNDPARPSDHLLTRGPRGRWRGAAVHHPQSRHARW